MPFTHLTLKGCSAIAIIYHYEDPNKVQACVSYNNEFSFNGRKVIFVTISEMIKLTKRNGRNMFPKDDFDSLQTWADFEFKDEKITLSLWSYINEQD